MVARSAPIALALALLPACSGNAVFDAPDPEGCATGHGCPTALCSCVDGAVVIDAACERGACIPTDALCEARCEERGGVASVVETKGDRLAVPDCSLFCDRLAIHGCARDCATVASECVAPSSCDAAGYRFWACAAGRAVISCEDDAVLVEGCEDDPPASCEP